MNEFVLLFWSTKLPAHYSELHPSVALVHPALIMGILFLYFRIGIQQLLLPITLGNHTLGLNTLGHQIVINGFGSGLGNSGTIGCHIVGTAMYTNLQHQTIMPDQEYSDGIQGCIGIGKQNGLVELEGDCSGYITISLTDNGISLGIGLCKHLRVYARGREQAKYSCTECV